MTPTEQDLARQLAAHPRWRWMAGMREESGDRISRIEGDRVVYVDREGDVESCPDDGIYFGIPDLADPATLGCLIAMLTDRLLTIGHRREEDDGGELWRIVIVADDGRMQGFRGDTFGEALARAVLDAWGGA